MVALCDVHQNAYGAQVAAEKFPKAKFYTDFREMLEKNLDGVTISTPDHTHANITKVAMEKGIHVYVQKPLTHNIKEARMLTELARKNKIVTQMGNQGASNPEQVMIQKWIKDGRIGKVSKVYTWTNRPVWPQGVAMQSLTHLKSQKEWIGIYGLDLLKIGAILLDFMHLTGEDFGIMEQEP